MLTKVSFKNWKSFEQADLFLDPLTIIIGTNSGGKSNALDALDFLHRSSLGMSLTSCLSGDTSLSPIRGGVEWASRNQAGLFSVGVVARKDDNTDFDYLAECVIKDGRCEVYSEILTRRKFFRTKSGERRLRSEIRLFGTDPVVADEPAIKARLYNEKSGSVRQLSRATSILSQLYTQSTRQEITEGVQEVVDALKELFILDPIPSHMRNYSPLSDVLSNDAGNIAGVLAALPTERKQEIERIIGSYLSRLPEKDISRVTAEPVGRFKSDAMLYCDENWKSGHPLTIDSRGMSDGTLRFLAILTALLTRPSGSLLVIEEVDNGLHPSRASLLLEMLQKIGSERRVDLLITTHNPALLDAMGPSLVPYITIAHRSQDSGSSELTLLENMTNLARVLSLGSLGYLSSRGVIERALKGQQLAFEFHDDK